MTIKASFSFRQKNPKTKESILDSRDMIHKTRPLKCTSIFICKNTLVFHSDIVYGIEIMYRWHDVFVRLCSVTWAAPNPASCSMLTVSTRGGKNQPKKPQNYTRKKEPAHKKTSSHTCTRVNIIQQHMMVNEHQHNLPSAPQRSFHKGDTAAKVCV